MKLYFNKKEFLLHSALSVSFFLVLAIPVLADDLPADELTISKNGDITVIGHVQLKQAANAFRISVWGQLWDILADYDVKFESRYGTPIIPADVVQDDIVQIFGKPTPATGVEKAGQISATLVRDLSNTTGQPPPPPIVSIAPATPKPASNQVIVKKDTAVSSGLLTAHLDLGARGDEVSLLQKFLEAHGSGIPDGGITTGYFGKITQKILASFQEANGLAAVGAVGAQTRQLINSIIQKEKTRPPLPASDGRLSLPIVKATTTEATSVPALLIPKKKQSFFFGY